MIDKLYYRELECYAKASESTIRMIGKKDYYDLSQLPSETMKCEFAQYLRKRSEQVSLNTIQHDKAYFNQCCEFFKTRRNLPDSLLDWEENRWITLLKAWMLQKGISLTTKHTSVYGNTHMVDARLIRYLKRIITFLQPEDLRPEHEKDIWHLEKLFINTDIPPEVEPEFKTYSDGELKWLNAHITKLDEQIARCIVIHQMLGTRISDTLTLQRDCLFQINGQDMIRIQQVKTNTFRKPVSAELATLIQKAIGYTEQRYGETTYIFVGEKDTSRPLQYTTIKHKVLGLIWKENLRDDEGNPFKFGTHMFRRSYGVKLTEMHLADETRNARAEQTRILLANIDGWGKDYEQIR